MEEQLKLVVMDPVARTGDFDQATVGDGLEAQVVIGHGQKAFGAPEEESGAGDLGEDFHGVGDVVAVRCHSAGVVVEFPEE